MSRGVLAERLHQYVRLTRLDRPIGTLLLLWPTLWSLWLASGGRPDPLVTAVFVAGVVLMRSAGCVINDYADRAIDPHVRRTRSRPLARGAVSPREALVLFAVLTLIAFGLVLLMNRMTVALSVVAVILAITYPFMKRHTHLPQVHLGLAFGWAVPMAWTAQTGHLPPLEGWLLLVATVLWAVAYDTMYAMVDREDDRHIGVKSTAILFGDLDRVLIGGFQIATLGVLTVVGVLADLGLFWYLGLAVAAALGAYQQVLIRDREPRQCFRAFLNNNWVGAAVFAGLAAATML